MKIISISLILLLFFTSISVAQVFQWAKSMGGTDHEYGNKIIVDDSNNLYITGHYTGTADLDPSAGTINHTSAGSYDTFLAKFDSVGNYLWSISIGDTGHDMGTSLVLDNLNNIYVTGVFSGTADFDPTS